MSPVATADCDACGSPLPERPGRGRPAKFCNATCRSAARRRRAAAAGSDPAGQPFATAVRTGIADRGLSLRALSQRLDDQGYPLTPATLSQWQTGRCTPHATTSGQHYVMAVERALLLPPGALLSQLEKTRRALDRAPAHPLAMTPGRAPAAGSLEDRKRRLDARIVAAGGGPSRQYLVCGDQEEHYLLGQDRRPIHSVVTMEVSATRAGVDRFWYVYCVDAQDQTIEITPLAGCRAVRTLTEDRRRTGPVAEYIAATELVFDRPLEELETCQFSFMVSYRYGGTAGRLPVREFRRVVTSPARRTLRLSITFDPRALPEQLRRCRWNIPRCYDRPAYARRVEDGHADVLVIEDPRPGGYGWQWDWPASDKPTPQPRPRVA